MPTIPFLQALPELSLIIIPIFLFVCLNIPSQQAIDLSIETDKDPKLVQLILNESKGVVRYRKGVIVVESILGLIHANAGIDRSNIKSDSNNPRVLLLPEDPDKSATELREGIFKQTNKNNF